ncbi:DUF4383 domain-containing protein [Streptomyces zaehneri]|uniref:DUF4383 domain-containing protein n=1 Tax=Streptomyces zaehneri TaxID=3051180 RepID=UPI0028D5B66F|nr:DUF4383 domain-containing protein [Streptomyces sp. DSM 40713]
MKLSDELPVDHKLATVYRYGAAFCGLVLLVFGVLGFADRLSPFDTEGQHLAGMSTNGVLSLISVVVGLVLIGGGIVGGNFASTLNMTVGTLFLLSGFVHVFVLDRPANVLDFGMSNVMFSFVMGLVILTFGMYGRVSSKLSHDNPYWRRRHAREAAKESLARRRQSVNPLGDGGRRAVGSVPGASNASEAAGARD